MALTVPAFAQQNTIVNTFNFFGNVARSDHAFAWVSVIGPYVNPNTATPLIIHFVDGTQDFTCNITGPGHVVTQNNIIGQNGIASGTITVTPAGCVNTHTGAPITPTGSMTWTFQQANYDNTIWNIIAKSINVMFPCTPVCLYDSFSGVGTI